LNNSPTTSQNDLYNGRVYNIPATKPFLKSIAIDFVENGSFQDLIMLPTKRSCRELQKEIYSLSKEKGLNTIILPNIMAFGEVNEDDLYFEESIVSPIDLIEKSNLISISNIERTSLLSKFIMAKFKSEEEGKAIVEYFGWDKAISLAFELGKLIDSFEIEEVDLNILNDIYPEEYSEHYQNVIKLLEVIKEYWDEILDAEGKINLAKKQVSEIKSFADFLETNNKYSRIVVAGTTGSQPATRYLIKKILHNENSVLILPSIDMNISEESWFDIGQSHPQYGMKFLLDELSINRKSIEEFPISKSNFQENKDLEIFISEIMKELGIELKNPSEKVSENVLNNISIIEGKTNREESELIAISILEHIKKSPEEKIVVVTPDRQMSKSITTNLKSFGIETDDSGGSSLSKSELGRYMLLTNSLISSNFDAYSLISFLENKYTNIIESFISNKSEDQNLSSKEIKNKKKIIIKNIIDLVFRGEKISKGIDEIINKLYKQKLLRVEMDNGNKITFQPHLTNISTNDIDEVISILNNVKTSSESLSNIFVENRKTNFVKVLEAHIKFIENICDYKNIFSNSDDGKVIQKTLIEIKNAMQDFNIEVSIYEYEKILEAFLDTKSIRSPQFNHNVSILGPIEARMLETDYLILAGLNEGIFPQGQKEDIFLNRKMRDELGLPLPERRIGLSSHDFATLITSSKKTLISYAQKRDGSISLPSRWIQKINSYLSRVDLSIDKSEEVRLRKIRNHLFNSKDFSPIKRTSFNPAKELRPKRLSATFVEKALKDPYQIYSRYILKLYKKFDINQEVSAADLGTIMHEALENFVKKDMTHRFDLTQEFERLLELKSVDDSIKIFWRGRFKKFADWFVPKYKKEKDQIIKHSFTEIKGSYLVPVSEKLSVSNNEVPLIIEGTADRIDQLQDGSFRIIDYKTGTCPTWTQVIDGSKAQMAIEALILEKGVFKSSEDAKELKTLMGGKVSTLAFITMSSHKNSVGDDRIYPKSPEEVDNLRIIIEKTESGLQTLNKEFLRKDRELLASPTSESQKESFFNDYRHLERIKEWKNNV
jgi:ATP-dependent helicase/nuclease subunit B